MRPTRLTKRVLAIALSATLFAAGGISAFAGAEETVTTQPAVEPIVFTVTEGDRESSADTESTAAAEAVSAQVADVAGAVADGTAEVTAQTYTVTENSLDGAVALSEISADNFTSATGIAVPGAVADGTAADGVVADGAAVDGAVDDGTVVEEGTVAADGTVADGTVSVEGTADGVAVDGTVADGTNADGNGEVAASSGNDRKWSVTTSKTVTENPDGSYLLKISVSTDRVEDVKNVDIIYLIDVSGSLEDDDLKKEKQAISDMTSSVETEKSKDVTVRYALIKFGSTSNTRIMGNGLDTSENLNELLNQINTTSGLTDMASAIGLINNLYKENQNQQDDLRKVIVLLTDGRPETGIYTYGDAESRKKEEEKVNTEFDKLGQGDAPLVDKDDRFYAVFFGRDDSEHTKTAFLESLSQRNPNGMNGSYYQSDVNDLSQTLADIAVGLGDLYTDIQGGELKDTLSASVDFEGADYTFKINGNDAAKVNGSENEYKVTIDGKDYVLTVKIDPESKTAIVNFPKDYPHIEGYTYTLETMIKMNDNVQTDHTDGKTVVYTNKNEEINGVEAYSYFKFEGKKESDDEWSEVVIPLQRPYIVLAVDEPASAPASASESYEASDETQDAVYPASEAPEVLGVTREEVVNVEEPMVLGARRNARTGDLTGLIQAACFVMSGITFALSRKKEDDAA